MFEEADRRVLAAALQVVENQLRTPFNPPRFAAALDRLPALPTDGDE